MTSHVPLIGKVRAYVRMILLFLVMTWYLGRLMLVSAICGEKEARGFRYRRKFTHTIMRMFGVRLHVIGSATGFPALYVGNHRSFLDPIIQLSEIDAYAVAKAEISGYPLIGRGARETGVIYIQRDSKESRMASRQTIRQLLQSGKSVLIYPEGTTSNLPATLPFRSGSFEIAVELGIPIVPVMIDYANPAHYWHGIPMLQFFVRKFSSKHIVSSLVIGEPYQMDNAQTALQYAQQWIGEKIRESRARFSPTDLPQPSTPGHLS